MAGQYVNGERLFNWLRSIENIKSGDVIHDAELCLVSEISSSGTNQPDFWINILQRMRRIIPAVICFLLITPDLASQKRKIRKNGSNTNIPVLDGVAAAGVADGRGFTNFSEPAQKPSKFILSALPSLQYKRDHSTPGNAFVTRNLGIGFTYSYEIGAIQNLCIIKQKPLQKTANGSGALDDYLNGLNRRD